MNEIIFDIETTTLNPLEEDARIIAIGLKCHETEMVITDINEKNLIKKFWNLPFFDDFYKLIGFNIYGFDLRYLLVRSMKYKLKVKPLRGRTIDIRLILGFGNKHEKGRLEDYSKLILNETKHNGIDGSSMVELWKKGEIKTISDYCMQDVLLTSKLYYLMKNMGAFE